MLKKLAVMLVLALFFTSGGASLGFAASVMESNVVTIGTEGTYPPFEFYDSNNNLTGFDIELTKAIVKKLGKEVKVMDMAFDGLIPALLTRKIDVVAAAMNATPERRQRVDFSDVYQIADAVLVTKTERDDLKKVEDLNGRRIGVQLGTIEDLYLSDIKTPVEVKRYQKTDDAVREVLLDRNDGVLLDTPVGHSYIDSDRYKGFLKVAFKETIAAPEDGFALAVRKGDAQFLEAVNEA
jgi:polar amino acid transport system substrate-binding protein